MPGVSTGAGAVGRASSSWRGVQTPPQQWGPLGGPVPGFWVWVDTSGCRWRIDYREMYLFSVPTHLVA